MRITAIEVDGVGRFGTATRVDGLGPGVNILSAGNEAGKSTLFRAVRACLFERHNSKNEFLRSLATDGLSLPVCVTLGFEHDGADYVLRKSFVKSPAASLARGGVEIARGREADERVWELLGIAPGGGRSVDEAAFGILWVGQGKSFDPPAMSDAAANALNAAIQEEVGTLVGGERARKVLAELKDELARVVTETGRPRTGGPLAEAEARLAGFARELEEAERRLAVLDAQLVDLAAKRAEGARLADPAIEAGMRSDLAAARAALKEGESAAALLGRFELAEQQARAALDRATQQRTDLAQRAARIDADRRREADLQAKLAPLDAEERAARDALAAARAEIAAIDAAAERDAVAERDLQRLAEALARAAGRDDLARRETALVALGDRLVANEAALAGNGATATTLTTLDAIEREQGGLLARLEAAAPHVSVTLGPEGAGRVEFAGRRLHADAAQAAVDPLTIRIGDIATVTVSPPAGAGKVEQQKLQQLNERLAALRDGAGVSTAAELRAAHARRRELEADAAGLRAELEAYGVRGGSPATALEKLRTEIARADSLVAEALATAGLAAPPAAADLAARQEALRGGRDTARRRRQTLEGTAEAQNATLARTGAARGELGGALGEIAGRLAADLAVLPDADRDRLIEAADARVAAATAEHGTKAAALEGQRSAAPSPEELERRATRVTRLEAALQNHEARRGTLEREIANLEGQIQSAGGDGLGERAEVLREERDLAARDVERHRGHVATLQLLRETIEACYQEQRDRLHAPLRRHLRPFLNDVFPQAELALGDGFAITGLHRAGPEAEMFERLSAGTQEQIAVLVRLAMGALICERGQEVPIVLDDALVFSDDGRIEQMFDALARAGRTQQVIVLTCRSRAFAKLGGSTLSIVPAG